MSFKPRISPKLDYYETGGTAATAGDGFNIIAVSNSTAASTGTINFSNSNGVSWGLNGSVLTATVKTDYQSSNANYLTNQTNQTVGIYGSSNTTGQSSSSTYDARSLTLRGAGIISVGNSGGEVIISASAAGAADGVNILAAGTQTAATTGTVLFNNSNGITFGMSNSSVITASHNGITQQSTQPVALSGSNGSFNFSTATFGNLNGMSFYTSNGSMVGSYTVPSQTNQSAIKGLGVSNTGQTAGNTGVSTGVDWVLAGSNSITLSQSTAAGGPNTIWVQHPAWLTTARASNDAIGLNTAQSNVTWTVNSSGLSLDARGYAGTGTTFNGANISGSITQNSNGIQISASVSQTNQTVGVYGSSQTTGSASSGTHDARSMSFIGAGLVSIGNHSTSVGGTTTGIVISATQSNQALSAGNGSFAFQTASFSNANGVSFSTSAGSAIVASHNGLTSQSNQDVSLFALGNTTQNSSTVINASKLSFNAINSLTVGFSNGSIQLSAPNALTTARASNDAIGLNTAQSNVTWTVNSSGLSLDARGYAGTGTTFNGANESASITLNSNGLQISASGLNQAVSNSAGSFTFQTLNFSNANNVTFGTSAGGIITASVAAPGAAAENNWVNLLGANTAGNTTASGSTIGYSGVNLTLSGTNGSVVNISAPATSSLSATGAVSLSTNGSTISIGVPSLITQSVFQPMPLGNNTAHSQLGNGSIHIWPALAEGAISISRVDAFGSISVSSSSNSSFAGNISLYFGVYSRNGSTLSQITSGSTNHVFSNTSNNSLNSIASFRRLSIPMNWNNTYTGDIYFAFMSRTSTTNANWFTASNWILTANTNTVVAGLIGETTNSTKQMVPGLGVYSASSTALLNSMGFSEINGQSNLRTPYVVMVNYTA